MMPSPSGWPTVLVTGMGAPPGVSIFKALRQSELMPRIVAVDADPASVGLLRADAAYVVPHAGHQLDALIDRLEEIICAERVSMVCVSSETELLQLAPHVRAIENRTGARLIVNEAEILGAFLDKWRTFELLAAAGLPVPDTALADDPAAVDGLLERHGLPLVVKPRRGSGSKGVVLVHTLEDLAFFRRYVPDAVVQEHLLPDDQEYTVGLYKSRRRGYVGQIVFQRTLSAGLTYKATVVHDPDIEESCRRLVEAFDVWGPINIQLRKTEQGVRIFEVNPRFSSTAVMRAWFGFNEAELCLRDVVLDQAIEPPRIRDGRAFRYWDEVYLPDGLGVPANGPVDQRASVICDDF